MRFLNDWGYEILIFATSFQKSNIDWPQTFMEHMICTYEIINPDTCQSQITLSNLIWDTLYIHYQAGDL